MKPLLIVNPRSGGGRTGEVFESMRAPVERILGEVDVAFTERPRHAVELSREAALSGREAVVAVGGDGSIHEVVNGLMAAREQDPSATQARLGIIGQGTGGDLRRTLGLEHRIDRYCAAIASGRTRRIDLGRMTYQASGGGEQSGHFVNILSAGLGGLVDRYVAETSKALGGKAAYLFASLRGLVESQVGHLDCELTFRGKKQELSISTRNIAICNGQYFGSGMHVAPMAALDDGVLEVVDLGDAGRVRFAAVSSKMYSGEHIGHADVKHHRCERIELRLENPAVAERFLLDIDGEPLGRLPLTVEVVPAALEIFVPG